MFIQYHEGFNFVTGKALQDFKDAHLTISNNAPSLTHYTKADIHNGYAIPQESPVYRQSKNTKLLKNKSGLILYTQTYRLTLS